MTTIAIGRAITLEREPSKKKQRTDTKKEANRIKSDKFTRSIRGKSNIAIAILEKLPFLKETKIISHFGGSNNIFADCILYNFRFDSVWCSFCRTYLEKELLK